MCRRILGLLVFLTAFLPACAGKADNAALARQAWARLQAFEMETLTSFYAEDAVIEDLGYGRTGRKIEGREQILTWLKEVRENWPGSKFPILGLVAEGDSVVVTWRWTGTPKGEAQESGLVPRPVDFRGITIWEFRNGKIQRELSVYNYCTVIEQLRGPEKGGRTEEER